MNCETLDEFLDQYGNLLGQQAGEATEPLHDPARDKPLAMTLLRKPFPAQAHVITALVKAMKRQKAVLLTAEMGTGKTLQGMAAAHAHAAGKPYRALVFCPGQLVKKWKREIESTLPNTTATILNNWREVAALRRGPVDKPTWYIIARDTAKLSAQWRPVHHHRPREGCIRCCACGQVLMEDKVTPLSTDALERKKLTCDLVRMRDGTFEKGCGAQLWTFTGKVRKYEPAKIIHKRLKKFFTYLILDEVHQAKSPTSEQANAVGALAAACPKVIALTGTLIGGYAWHVRSLLFRLAPSSLVAEGHTWKGEMGFNEQYGRIDTTIREKSGGGIERSMKNGRGTTGGKSVSKTVKPGVMPSLFGAHLIDKCVFLSLDDVAEGLPTLTEECISVPMSPELAKPYQEVEGKLKAAIKSMLVKGDRRLLGKMLMTLMAYPDYPFDWEAVGYHDRGDGGGEGAWHTVVEPENLDRDVVYPKEEKLLELVRAEVRKGRQTWVYVQFTDKRDVLERLRDLLERNGFKAGVLRSSIPLTKREAWIAKNAPGKDVVLSHPQLVETGLDLFDKNGKYNFPTLIFYE